MAAIHSDNSFKIALITEDLQGDQSRESFATVCEHADSMMEAHDIGSNFARSYSSLFSNSTALVAQIKTDMLDNYMIAVFMLRRMKFPTNTPLIAWAARNKMDFEGLHGEIATMRSLMWAGFDPSVPDPNTGTTALHAMCNLQWGGGAHSRGIHHLIEGGADVNAQSETGDTPLITLCGHTGWGAEMSGAFKILYNAGADADQKSNDGVSAWALLNTMQKEYPEPLREELIAEVEAA